MPMELNLKTSLLCIMAVFFNLSLADQLPVPVPMTVPVLVLDTPGNPTNDNTTNAANICASTLYPKFCRSTLLPFSNEGANVNDYGRISLRQSLSHAKKFLKLVRSYKQVAPTYFPSSVGALADCEFLALANVDSLSFSLQSVNFTNDLGGFTATDVQTLLSATLTNLDTCLEGLKTKSSSTVSNGLDAPVANATKLCSVSLNLFDRGWLRKLKKKGRKLDERPHTFAELRNGVGDGLPLRMSEWDKQRFEELTKRRVLADTTGSVKVTAMVVVDRKGRGNFTTINDAVNSAPNNTAMGSGYYVIFVAQGVYREYVNIPRNKQYVMMIGQGIGRTIITGNRSVVDGSTTFNSSTFAVVGQGFVGINMTIRNTAGAIKHQAVALRNGADMSSFYSCSIEGFQDTLYAHSLRQFYRDCQITGTVDFIFGNAAVVFQNCRIIARQPMVNQFNAITAQGKTDPNQNTGTALQNCTLKAAKELLTSNYTVKTYLGRPWKNYSTTVYLQSKIGGFVDPTGWSPWDGDFALATLYYAEFNNTGPGANTTNRVTWPGFHVINVTDAYNFTVGNFTQGNVWLPTTGTPFNSGI